MREKDKKLFLGMRELYRYVPRVDDCVFIYFFIFGGRWMHGCIGALCVGCGHMNLLSVHFIRYLIIFIFSAG